MRRWLVAVNGFQPRDLAQYVSKFESGGFGVSAAATHPDTIRIVHDPQRVTVVSAWSDPVVLAPSIAPEDLVTVVRLLTEIHDLQHELREEGDGDAVELLAAIVPRDATLDRVRAAVTRVLRTGPPTLASVARTLRASPRTVQRRLKEAGSSHRGVVDEVRRELAIRYLATPGLSITEIAFLLGFTDDSSFRRVYKRWTGRSPARTRSS
jgi:AraC-like DNA-binding protein